MKKFISCVAVSVAMLASYAFAAEPASFDFGDAPDPAYPALLGSNGARHKDISRAWLGVIVGSEGDARVRDLDLGDDGLVRENPVTFRATAAPLPAEQRAWYLRIVDFFTGRGRNRPYFLNVLIDRDNNGAWERSNEWVVQNQRIAVPAGSTVDARAIGVDGSDVLWDRATEGWLRVTLTDVRLRDYDGTTRNPFQVGETEDYTPLVEPENPKREFTFWCFVEEKACRALTKDQVSEARDNKIELKGPYNTNAACMLDCGEKTIETPTPRRKMPPAKPPENPAEKPVEKTIPTKSPATATCLGDNVFQHPFDGPITCSSYSSANMEYRCCDSGPVGQPIYACHGATLYEWSVWPADSVTECYGTP
ncbi:MAG: hypothetical protein Q7R85_04350 [bacterium]|nr:hypothetical protein [bacterium]